MALKEQWHPVETKAGGEQAVAAYERLEHLFLCINSLMERKVRISVEQSLADLREVVEIHKDGNEFTGEYSDQGVRSASLLSVDVLESNGAIVLSPTFEEITKALQAACSTVATSADNLRRIEAIAFPSLAEEPLRIHWGDVSDQCIANTQIALDDVAAHNNRGPAIYLKLYDRYAHLMVPPNGVSEAEKEVIAILANADRPLEVLGAHIEKLNALATEILGLRRSVPLNLVLLDCLPLHEYLAGQARRLVTLILDTVSERGRVGNRSICDRFDAMGAKLMERPADTEHMTQLDAYLQKARGEIMFKLKADIVDMSERLRFLADHGALTADDMAMNASTLKWPERVEPMFEVAQRRVDETRQGTESELKTRVADFEKKLEDYCAQIEAFREKADNLRSDEINRNVKALEMLKASIEEAKQEAAIINREQELLEWDVTNFTQIQHVVMTAEPFEKLWQTAQQFNNQKELWFDGPFLTLDAEAISEELGNMWRTMYKLSKTFTDMPGPQKTAESLKSKMEKFKVYVPLLQCICNKGLRDRHWEKISDLSGFDIHPDDTTSLSQMLAMNLDKLQEQLEEISTAASKEYSLEKALKAMKSEWGEILFTLVPYRDTGVSILSGVDDVQVKLDDHIVMTQTMRGSPFIKPFEAEITAWEAKLVDMQVRARKQR